MTVGQMLGGRGRDWSDLMATPYVYQPGRIIAGEDLPKGASAFFSVTEAQKIALDRSRFRLVSSEEIPLEVFLRRNQIYVSGFSAPFWISHLPFAEDVHSEAARLSISCEERLSSKVSLVLTLVKAVRKGEALNFWFSSEMASELGMPFLTFSHVKDGCYACPSCEKRFESPNPLKLHLATACETLSSGFLWERLWNSFASIFSPWEIPRLMPRKRETPREGMSDYYKSRHQPLCTSKAISGDVFVPYSFSKSLFTGVPEAKSMSPDSTSRDQKKPLVKKHSRFSVDSKGFKHSEIVSQHSRTLTPHSLSAFTPVVGSSHQGFRSGKSGEISALGSELKGKNYLTGEGSSMSLVSTSPPRNNLPFIASLPKNSILASVPNSSCTWEWPHVSFSSSNTSLPSLLPLIPSTSSLPNPSLPSTSSIDPSADVEMFVSSLGRGKGSHLCLYCGKVYSRKYGLKIHIRTHTGYKPLKCRVCLRPFGDPSNLNKHIRLHAQGETPYRCDLCGKVLVRKRDLDRHLRSRHPKAILPKLQSGETHRDCPEEELKATTSPVETSGEHCFIIRADSCSQQEGIEKKTDLTVDLGEKCSKVGVAEGGVDITDKRQKQR